MRNSRSTFFEAQEANERRIQRARCLVFGSTKILDEHRYVDVCVRERASASRDVTRDKTASKRNENFSSKKALPSGIIKHSLNFLQHQVVRESVLVLLDTEPHLPKLSGYFLGAGDVHLQEIAIEIVSCIKLVEANANGGAETNTSYIQTVANHKSN
ncbi:hypothetical protein CBL_10406 [Carabus blaptoides fortunei]